MYRPLSPQPSGLLQHQPQRYSDRHVQQTSSSGKNQTRHPCTAQMHDGMENSLKPGDTTQTGKQDDAQGIKSYLKKTDGTNFARVKPDSNKKVEELKKTEIQSLK